MQVLVEGSLQGTTGADGVVDIGVRTVGTTLDLLMTGGSGDNAITPSNQDTIDNDSITV